MFHPSRTAFRRGATSAPASADTPSLVKTKPNRCQSLACGLKNLYASIDGTQEKKESTIHFNRYEINFLAGKGRFADVYRATDLYSGQPVVLKIVPHNLRQLALQEISNVNKLTTTLSTHPGMNAPIPKIYNAFHTSRGEIAIVYPFLGESIAKWFALTPETVGRAPSQQDLKHIAWGVLKALAAMSNCGFIHGDVKFDNVLWRESNGVPEVHLIDYGNSFPLEAVRCYTDEYEVAPLGFRAPEVLIGLRRFDTAIDMWGLGMMLLSLACRRVVNTAMSRKEAVKNITNLLGPLPALQYRHGKFALEVEMGAEPSANEVQRPRGGLGRREVAGLGPSTSPLPSTVSKKPPVPVFGEEWTRREKYLSLISTARSLNGEFIDFLLDCLEYSPQRRLKPLDAMWHPFVQPLNPLSMIHRPVGILYQEPSALACEALGHSGECTQFMTTIRQLKEAALPSVSIVDTPNKRQRVIPENLSTMAVEDLSLSSKTPTPSAEAAWQNGLGSSPKADPLHAPQDALPLNKGGPVQQQGEEEEEQEGKKVEQEQEEQEKPPMSFDPTNRDEIRLEQKEQHQSQKRKLPAASETSSPSRLKHKSKTPQKHLASPSLALVGTSSKAVSMLTKPKRKQLKRYSAGSLGSLG